ncbi:MAG: hypothetical protein FWH20_10880 [Oscillospiraceae bacterium]|nr:hypothetical protein [Oscillospiraceae bacterium]
MEIKLKGNPHLLDDELSYAAYAEAVENLIIDPETRRLIQKYGVNQHELILIGAKPLSEYKNQAKSTLLLDNILKGKRIYFSRITMTDDCFEFLPPEQITFAVEEAAAKDCKRLQKTAKRFSKKQKAAVLGKRHSLKMNDYLVRINREAARNLILSAKRDFDFIVHFNSEMFYHNITAKGHTFTKETVSGIYEDEKYTKIINLSDPRERMGFIALYAMTFHGLKLDDIYSIDGIFSLEIQSEIGAGREADEKKRLAGAEVFNLVFGEERAEIHSRAVRMAEVLKNLPLPEINLSLNNLIKRNYPLYCGAGDIGRSYSKLILSVEKEFDAAVKIAHRLSYYRLLERLYDEVLKNGEDYAKSALYKKAKAFAGAADGKKIAGELDFVVKSGFAEISC